MDNSINIPDTITELGESDAVDYLNRKYRYDKMNYLGSGSFGKVVGRGEHAIKRISRRKKQYDAFTIHEIDILRALQDFPPIQHFVPKYYETVQTVKYYYIVMEYLDGIQLLDFLNELHGHTDLRIEISLQIMYMVYLLNHYGIFHLDIKPENMMIISHNRTYRLVFVDFGFSCIYGKVRFRGDNPESNSCAWNYKGTGHFIIPYVVKQKYPELKNLTLDDLLYMAAERDTWSICMTVWEVITGKMLYNEGKFYQLDPDQDYTKYGNAQYLLTVIIREVFNKAIDEDGHAVPYSGKFPTLSYVFKKLSKESNILRKMKELNIDLGSNSS